MPLEEYRGGGGQVSEGEEAQKGRIVIESLESKRMKKKIEQDPRRALNTDLIGDDRLNKLSAYLHLSTPCSDPRARAPGSTIGFYFRGRGEKRFWIGINRAYVAIISVNRSRFPYRPFPLPPSSPIYRLPCSSPDPASIISATSGYVRFFHVQRTFSSLSLNFA